VTLILDTDPPLRGLDPFPQTDSKDFLGLMFGPRRAALEAALGLDLAPLHHCASDTSEGAEQMLREDWGDEAEAMIAEYRRHSELAWHSPDEYIACLGQLAELLERHGRKLPEAACRAVDPRGQDRAYFQSGSFCTDVVGCLAAIRAAKEQGARRVRFFAF
jgi:hypothetical protein